MKDKMIALKNSLWYSMFCEVCEAVSNVEQWGGEWITKEQVPNLIEQFIDTEKEDDKDDSKRRFIKDKVMPVWDILIKYKAVEL